MSTSLASPRPRLVPEDYPLRSGFTRPGVYLERAATAALIAEVGHKTYPDIIKERWPGDEVSPIFLGRAAVTPTSTTTGATALAGTASVADFVSSLPRSAASRLIAAGLRLDLAGRSTVSIPRVATRPIPTFIAEGGPVPVAQLALAENDLGPPAKLAVIVGFTNEMVRRTNVEALVRLTLGEAAGASLDAALFSTTAASAIRPAGLLNGLTPITASAVTPEGEAMVADLSALIAAIVAAGGSGEVIFVASPLQAAAIKLRSPNLGFPVYGTTALAAGTVIAIEPSGFVSAFDAIPRIEASPNATVHYEDTTPLALASGAQGSGVLATPVRSSFQTDTLTLRMILPAAWTTRDLAWSSSSLA